MYIYVRLVGWLVGWLISELVSVVMEWAPMYGNDSVSDTLAAMMGFGV